MYHVYVSIKEDMFQLKGIRAAWKVKCFGVQILLPFLIYLRDHKEAVEPLWDSISLSAKIKAISLKTNDQNANKLSDKVLRISTLLSFIKGIITIVTIKGTLTQHRSPMKFIAIPRVEEWPNCIRSKHKGNRKKGMIALDTS